MTEAQSAADGVAVPLSWDADVMDQLPDGVVVADGEGRIVLANRRFEDLFGYAAAELIGQPVEVLVPEAARMAHVADRRRYGRAPSVRPMGSGLELAGRHRDGHEIPVEVALSPLERPDGTRFVIATIRDVTAARVAAQAARRQSELLAAAFDQAPVAMALTRLADDGTRPIERANAACHQLLGYPTGALEGRLFNDLTHPDDQKQSDAAANRMSEQGQRLVLEKRYLRADGSWLWAELNAALVTGPSDENRTTLSHIIDLSDRRRAMDLAERQRRLWETMAVLTAELLGDPDADVASAVCRHARVLLAADTASLVEAPHDSAQYIRMGFDGPEPAGGGGPGDPAHEAAGSVLEGVARSGRARRVDHDGPAGPADPTGTEGDGATAGAALYVPVEGAREPLVLVVARSRDRTPFDDDDLQEAARYAQHINLVMELARLRTDERLWAVITDRERIARDLHDRVISQLFGTGLSLQAVASTVSSPPVRDKLLDAVDGVDRGIAELRQSIFFLTHDEQMSLTEFRRLLGRSVEEKHRALGFAPRLTVDGADRALSRSAVGEVVSTVSEALANVARHAGASRAEVKVVVGADSIVLEVNDDGRGLDPERGPGTGLGNLRTRAEARGGQLTVRSTPGTGVRLRWTISET